jgi:uncharacterized protein (DUF58 family)
MISDDGRRPEMPDESKRTSLSFILHPSSLILPTAGRYYLLVTVLLVAVGIHRSINLLLLLGYALLVMAGLNLLAARRSVHGLRGRRRRAEWLFARKPCPVEVQVSNPNRRLCLGVRIEDGGANHALTWFAEALPGLDSQTFRAAITLQRRGRYSWGALVARSGYPLGLIEWRQVLAADEEVIVFPALGWLHRGRFLRHLRGLASPSSHLPARRRPRIHPAAQAEFHGLRSYRTGDSPRLIHWRTSARRGELMVREFEDEPSDNLLLVVDPTLPAESDYAGVPLREQFEEAISLAATLCWEWCRRRGDHLVLAAAGPRPVVQAGLTGPTQARRVLECLAALECGPGPADPAVIAALKASSLPPAVVVLLSLGRSALIDPLTRALSRPVNALDATRTDRFDFYTPPS